MQSLPERSRVLLVVPIACPLPDSEGLGSRQAFFQVPEVQEDGKAAHRVGEGRRTEGCWRFLVTALVRSNKKSNSPVSIRVIAFPHFDPSTFDTTRKLDYPLFTQEITISTWHSKCHRLPAPLFLFFGRRGCTAGTGREGFGSLLPLAPGHSPRVARSKAQRERLSARSSF